MRLVLIYLQTESMLKMLCLNNAFAYSCSIYISYIRNDQEILVSDLVIPSVFLNTQTEIHTLQAHP
jgi:hypothetical protein